MRVVAHRNGAVCAGSRGRALARAGLRGRSLPARRRRAAPGPPLRPQELRLARAHEPERRGGALRAARGAAPQVAVVGPGTAEALREHGVEPALVAERSTQEGLAAQLRAGRGASSSPVPRSARRPRPRARRRLRRRSTGRSSSGPSAFPDADLVVLASASAARSFAALKASTFPASRSAPPRPPRPAPRPARRRRGRDPRPGRPGRSG